MGDKKKIGYDFSGLSEKKLEKMIQKGSGATVQEATAAYNELSKRRGDMGFTVTMILGGRKRGADEMEVPKPRPSKKEREEIRKKAEMRYGGMANGKKHMYACGGSVHSKK